MKNCAVISPKGDVLQIFIEPQTIWIWDKVFNEENRLISLEQKGLAFSTAFISPISSNPKVRHFKYSFNLNVSAGLPAKLQVLRFEKERGRTLEGELEYWATEFIEKNSKDISLFYNRLDNNQQKRFFEMAREFINPKIKDSGTQIATARFDLPS